MSHLVDELVITASDPSIWIATGMALVLGLGTFALGHWMVRRAGLLRAHASAAEIMGVSLASGLLVIASMWAAFRSTGQSAFLPVAIAFAAGIAASRGHPFGVPRTRSMAIVLIASGVFVLAVALVYGATLDPSIRDGVQPVEYPDEAFYAVLSRDLATTGQETTLSATGFGPIAGLPTQTWYHWGEMWLGAAVGSATGISPMFVRYQVVLPLLLLTSVLLAGTVARVALGTNSRWPFALGAIGCLFLVPVPLAAGPYFSSWAFGMALGITLYGLAAPTALLAIYAFATTDSEAGWGNGIFRGGIAAALLPAHIVIAGLAAVGAAVVGIARVGELRSSSRGLRRAILAAGSLFVAGGIWGLASGHGLGGTGEAGLSRVPAFNATWSATVLITLTGGGILLAIPIAWLLRLGSTFERSLALFVVAIVAFGAAVWGARLADANAFYAYFAGLAVFAPPVAAIAVQRLREKLRERRQLLVAAALNLLVVVQLAWGVGYKTIPAMVASGPLAEREPIPVDVLDRIRALPADARLAYACRPREEATFAQPQLLSIDLHTGRRVVPMCFEADGYSLLVGGDRDAMVANESFTWAPQRELYPDAKTRPSEADVAAWLKTNGIEYVYVDRWRPNPVGEHAAAVITVGTVEVLQLR